ncbi:26S proteasome non-ATPase regulatory subunit 4 [Sciurus carolinensis]|uniref:26S proteasome non-ATPase regulatory subunit 4 n=1 Tax=Sciurus carolinensis TaxID=30640 RepID=A0AA41MGH1_SCICA|nr:26S proteasome non-ATPase regulatory subunit 4 [Sciurus carolinensis]
MKSTTVLVLKTNFSEGTLTKWALLKAYIHFNQSGESTRDDIEDDIAELCKSTSVAHIWSVPMKPGGTEDSDESLLNMTISQQEFGCTGLPDLSSKIEKEKIAYAMQMSLQGTEFGQTESANLDANSAMDKSEPTKEEDNYDMMQDPEFFQSVLENLLGVDTDNEDIQNAIGSLDSQTTKDGKKDKKEEDKK